MSTVMKDYEAPTGIISYFLAARRMRRERLAIEKIRDGNDEELKDILISIVAIEMNGNPETAVGFGSSHAEDYYRRHYESLERSLREVLLPWQDPELGKKRRKLLRRAGYVIYLCGEDNPAIATIGVRAGSTNVFARQL